MIVTFCGHADYQKKEEDERKLLALLEERIGDMPVQMYLGGYGSFDEFAYDCCRSYREKHPQTCLVWVTPYLDFSRRQAFDPPKYDDILYPEIEDKPLKFAIIYRNRYMVEKADLVVAYVSHAWGGAYASYQYARRKGKEIFNLAAFRE